MKWVSMLKMIEIVNAGIVIHWIPTKWIRDRLIMKYFEFTRKRLKRRWVSMGIIARETVDDGDNWGECSQCGGIVYGSPIGSIRKQCECHLWGSDIGGAGRKPMEEEISKCTARGPWIRNSLRHRSNELRSHATRTRAAFKKDFMATAATCLADTCDKAADVFDETLKKMTP